jgi:predicted DNA-binding WGR domain protein
VRRFEFVGGGSNKFWEIGQSDSEVTVHFGRIGTNGQAQTKDLGSWDAAAERVRKLIREKIAEGYVEVGGGEPKVASGTGFLRPHTFPPYEVPTLPGDGPVTIGGVQIPTGRSLRADPKFARPGLATISGPVLWATDAPMAGAGRTLYELRQGSALVNLVPILLSGLSDDPKRPWNSGEFSPTDPRSIDFFDAAAELGKAWQANFSDEEDQVVASAQPFGIEFPGLASPPAITNQISDDGDLLDKMNSRRVALVAAMRPADAITAIGWMGAVNVHDDPALMSAVLRSWEIRWHARVVEIGFDTLTLTVGNPPLDERTSLALAAEHMAFCPDNIWQGSETLVAYARSLLRNRRWDFWWD